MSTALFNQRSKVPLEHVVETAKQSAPYLCSLLEAYPGTAQSLSEQAPEAILAHMLEAPQGDLSALSQSLRHSKRRVHLLCALCDIAGVWDWAIVTRALSDFGDMAMRALVEASAHELGFKATERGPVPGLFILALGKYGGRELNYSSDIDLTVFYDPDHIQIPENTKPQRILIRFVKTVMRAFDEITAGGYIFRTDLRLRPDPRSTAIAVSTRAAERYYESFGQNWERSAMIKARFVGGDETAAAEFSGNVLRPFVWRRTLDYAAIADIHSIKRQITKSKLIDDLIMPGQNVKLGLGGIREIEFFVTVQQLILGGRHKALRTPRTVDALKALVDCGFVDPQQGEILARAYARLRLLEHRVQMLNDEQTHIWPQDMAKREALAGLCNSTDVTSFEAEQVGIFKDVHAIYGDLFAEEDDLASDYGSLVFTGVEAEEETLKTFTSLGYGRGKEVWGLMADWLGGRIRATRTPRARELLTRLAPRIIVLCGQTGASDTAFFNFSEFITRLNAGVSLFSFLLSREDVLEALIKLLALSPKLATTLAQYPEQIESMLDPDFGDLSRFSNVDYGHVIEAPFDFEQALNGLRRTVHEDQLSLSATVLNTGKSEHASQALSRIAEEALRTACRIAQHESESKVGPRPGDYAVIALGKLAGHELSLSSDLDIMIVYQGGDGHWYNTFTRRLITALSSTTQDGMLYEIDMALRPSGRAGPLSVPLDAFSKYYADKAWTWEFLALSKAKVVAGSDPAFCAVVMQHITTALNQAPDGATLQTDVAAMLARLKAEKPARHDWDIKRIDGGLRDVEFIAQYLTLKRKPKTWPNATRAMLEAADGLDDDERAALFHALDIYGAVTQITAMVNAKDIDPRDAPALIQTLLANAAGYEHFADLQRAFEAANARVCALSKKLL